MQDRFWWSCNYSYCITLKMWNMVRESLKIWNAFTEHFWNTSWIPVIVKVKLYRDRTVSAVPLCVSGVILGKIVHRPSIQSWSYLLTQNNNEHFKNPWIECTTFLIPAILLICGTNNVLLMWSGLLMLSNKEWKTS